MKDERVPHSCFGIGLDWIVIGFNLANPLTETRVGTDLEENKGQGHSSLTLNP